MGRFDQPQSRQVLRVSQQRRTRQRQIVLRELDLQPQIGGLAVGIGDGLNDVQVEVIQRRQVGLHQHAIVEVVARERLADMVGGVGHQNIEIGHAVDGLTT